CFSVREVVEAREYGSDIVKLFPGSAFKPSIIKDIKAPIKGIGIMVSGGISYDNMSEWVSNGCDIISIGSSIVNLKDPVIIEKETRKYIERIYEIKN
ncbi:bifunctional 2-keto-4-hydroxyglutarate aldolase/2-keto-3-deoxy-6-phosphogluconate aldolase, partial [Clostridium perfringens]|nr:bifunctional 2-keto-4-hydroxyglutarate aldolase/2-keto-3-deoxy-6-phosphogluconate aldolase [Clostridium perfringens]